MKAALRLAGVLLLAAVAIVLAAIVSFELGRLVIWRFAP
jgi:uncharacterized membrane protein YqjE